MDIPHVQFGTLTLSSHLEDYQRAEFLSALDGNSAITISEWEQRFLQGNLGSYVFTPKQREVIDSLYLKYNHDNWFVPFVRNPPF